MVELRWEGSVLNAPTPVPFHLLVSTRIYFSTVKFLLTSFQFQAIFVLTNFSLRPEFFGNNRNGVIMNGNIMNGKIVDAQHY